MYITYSVINAPFHKIQPKTAVNMAVPAHHWPPTTPLPNTPSVLKAPTPRKNKIYISKNQYHVFIYISDKSYQRMENSITKPTPELLLIKEFIGLSKHIHLWIFIKHSCRYKLIENTNHQWW